MQASITSRQDKATLQQSCVCVCVLQTSVICTPLCNRCQVFSICKAANASSNCKAFIARREKVNIKRNLITATKQLTQHKHDAKWLSRIISLRAFTLPIDSDTERNGWGEKKGNLLTRIEI